MIKYLSRLKIVEEAYTAKVFPGLNAVKGILIMLVIYTHSLPNGMLLYFNYFFHMPVFLAVSGYLLKRSAFKFGIFHYLQRLFHRLIIPWLIATVCYFPFSFKHRHLADFTLTDIIYPFYHLWYVPAYVIGVLICFTVIKLRIPAIIILILTGAFTIVWYDIYRSTYLAVEQQPLYILGEKRFYSYQVFFFLGFALRNGLIQIKLPALLLVIVATVAFVASVILVYSNASDYTISVPYMFFNLSLVLFLLLYFAPLALFQHPLILLINKQSLGIYLYHPMIIFSIYHWLGDPHKLRSNNFEGFGVGTATLVIVLSGIWMIQQWDLANRLLLGIVEKAETVKNTVVKATTIEKGTTKNKKK